MAGSWAQVYGPGYQARHEAGHAAGFLAQGIALSYATIRWEPRPHTQPVDVRAGTYGQRVLASVSGVVAGFEFQGWQLSDRGIVRLLCGSPDGRFEFVGPAGRIQLLERAPLVAVGEDLARISPEHAEQPFTPEGAIGFWRDCERYVVSRDLKHSECSDAL